MAAAQSTTECDVIAEAGMASAIGDRHTHLNATPWNFLSSGAVCARKMCQCLHTFSHVKKLVSRIADS
jgi:hypothetical protein